MLSDKVTNEELIQEAIEYIEILLKGNSDGHGKDHAMRVYHNSMVIAETEACNKPIVALAAILHDADDHKLFNTKDNANARAFLMQHGVKQNVIEQIVTIINAVSFSKNGDKKPETMEGMIVQDADRLDAMGAVGIARTFAYGGKHGRDLDSSIQHFYDKLLLLKDLMNTNKARELAKKRHDYLEKFMDEWKAEMGGSEPEEECIQPDIDLDKVIQVLHKREKDLKAYLEIMEMSHNPDGKDFQRKYDAFYRVRRGDEWREEYFRLMKMYMAQGNASFEDILSQLYKTTSQVEASFASKMLATLDDNMPIWDNKVLTALKPLVSEVDTNMRLSNIVQKYESICRWYQAFLKTEVASEIIERFDEEFPEFKPMSKTKKIDFILWASE